MEATILYSHVGIKGSWAFTVNCSGIIHVDHGCVRRMYNYLWLIFPSKLTYLHLRGNPKTNCNQCQNPFTGNFFQDLNFSELSSCAFEPMQPSINSCFNRVSHQFFLVFFVSFVFLVLHFGTEATASLASNLWPCLNLAHKPNLCIFYIVLGFCVRKPSELCSVTNSAFAATGNLRICV